MRIKTLAIVMISAMSLFTAFYWITDPARREAAYQTQIKELLAYGAEVFKPADPQFPDRAGCASCHGIDGTGGQVGTTGRLAPNLLGPAAGSRATCRGLRAILPRTAQNDS